MNHLPDSLTGRMDFSDLATPASDSGLSPAQQAQLAQLNLDFLYLLREVARQTSSRWQRQLGMAATQTLQLSRLRRVGLQRVAQSDLALFAAHFHDHMLWQRLRNNTLRMPPGQRYASLLPYTQTSVQRTCMVLFESMLFFVWHLVRQQPDQARLIIGMAPATVRILASLDIWQCQFVAHHHCGLLQPRWRHNSYFWSDLLHYGESADPLALQVARAAATQLQAQEIMPDAMERLCRPAPPEPA